MITVSIAGGSQPEILQLVKSTKRSRATVAVYCI